MSMSQKTRNELSEMYRAERSELRCKLTKDLIRKASVLTREIDPKIDVADKLLSTLKKQKSQMLKDNKFYELVENPRNPRNTCALETKHPDLIAFDAETNAGRREILERK